MSTRNESIFTYCEPTEAACAHEDLHLTRHNPPQLLCSPFDRLAGEGAHPAEVWQHAGGMRCAPRGPGWLQGSAKSLRKPAAPSGPGCEQRAVLPSRGWRLGTAGGGGCRCGIGSGGCGEGMRKPGRMPCRVGGTKWVKRKGNPSFQYSSTSRLMDLIRSFSVRDVLARAP